MPEQVLDVEILSIDMHDQRWIAIHYVDPNKMGPLARETSVIEVSPSLVKKQLIDLLETAHEILERGQIEVVNPPETITRRDLDA